MTTARPAFPNGPQVASLSDGVRRIARALGVRRPRFLRGDRVERPLLVRRVDTDRLVLRRHRMSDTADWFALQSSASVRDGLRWPTRDARQSRRHLRDRTRHVRLEQADDFAAWAVEFDGVVIGDVSLHLRDVRAATRSAEMGWVLNPAYTGKGYAAEAADAALALAFLRLAVTVVHAEIRPENLRSRALAGRLGFVQVSATRHTLTRADWDRLRRR